jgi:ketosteroid isomerase-like protein
MKKTTTIVILSLLTAISIFAQRPGSGSDLDRIRDNTLAFSDAIVSGDVVAIINSYTSDAKIFPTGSDILEGNALEAYWKMNARNNTTFHKVTALNIEIIGDTAYDHGYYEGRTLNEDG